MARETDCAQIVQIATGQASRFTLPDGSSASPPCAQTARPLDSQSRWV